ncbi:hypothetical protein AB0M45_20805 [Nocardia sp. NPDC051787]
MPVIAAEQRSAVDQGCEPGRLGEAVPHAQRGSSACADAEYPATRAEAA